METFLYLFCAALFAVCLLACCICLAFVACRIGSMASDHVAQRGRRQRKKQKYIQEDDEEESDDNEIVPAPQQYVKNASRQETALLVYPSSAPSEHSISINTSALTHGKYKYEARSPPLLTHERPPDSEED